jgi:uncharacterized peroxidase-related enzyme
MTIHNTQTASPDSAKLLSEVDSQVGFIPNVFAVLAESTPALSAFVGLNGAFAESTLSAIEREVVEIATSAVNSCGYCVAGHTVFAQQLAMDAATIDALRAENCLSDPRLDALANFARALARRNGHDCEAELTDLFGVGYTRAQALEIIIGVSVKTISNLASNAFGIPIDDAFSACEWRPSSNHQTCQTNVA